MKKFPELKPCPFCGTQPGLSKGVSILPPDDKHPQIDEIDMGYTIGCETCGVELSDEYCEDLVTRWNKRHGDPEPAPTEEEGQ